MWAAAPQIVVNGPQFVATEQQGSYGQIAKPIPTRRCWETPDGGSNVATRTNLA